MYFRHSTGKEENHPFKAINISLFSQLSNFQWQSTWNLTSNNVQHTGNENAYKAEAVLFIKHQILITNLGNVLQLEGRINKQILGIKGFTSETLTVAKKHTIFSLYWRQSQNLLLWQSTLPAIQAILPYTI